MVLECSLSSLDESLILFTFNSQEPAIGPYHEPDKACRYTGASFMYNPF
jgi:hypothetical protein